MFYFLIYCEFSVLYRITLRSSFWNMSESSQDIDTVRESLRMKILLSCRTYSF